MSMHGQTRDPNVWATACFPACGSVVTFGLSTAAKVSIDTYSDPAPESRGVLPRLCGDPLSIGKSAGSSEEA